MVREYKERPKPAGIFQVKNTANGKVLLGSSLNLEGSLNKHKFMLTNGMHRNRMMQDDWNACGGKSFTFGILDTVRIREDPDFDADRELRLLEAIWTEEIQPFGENGYNRDANIREA